MDGLSAKSDSKLEEQLKALLQRRQTQSLLRNLTTVPAGAIDFSSNDFLSFSSNKTLQAAFLNHLANAGDSLRLGSGGSRLLDGNSFSAEKLEHEIAEFHNAPTALLFNSGFDANAGFFACVPQPGDIIVYDSYIHASVHDGMKLSRAVEKISFEHNNIESLRANLNQCKARYPAVEYGKSSVFIAVEAIYSMDGDLTPLRDFVTVVEEVLPAKNGHIIIDEAHSTGVLGPQGRGLVCELELEKRIFARLHTFGKAMACNGAAVLCSPIVRHYLINYARPLIYTTFMSYPSLVAIRVSYQYLKDGQSDSHRDHLFALIEYLFTSLQALALRRKIQPGSRSLVTIPATCPRSPIFSIMTPEPRSLAKHCQRLGFVVRAVVPPTVPTGTERIRVCLHSGNTFHDISCLMAAIDGWIAMHSKIDRPTIFKAVL